MSVEEKHLSKFIIFAQARTGSTTLAAILNVHPKINISFEPFCTEENVGISFSKNYLKDSQQVEFLPKQSEFFHWVHQYPISVLKNVLEEIHKKFNGIKHLSYSLPYQINQSLLSQPEYKVIFLTRRNLLQQVVSINISQQSGEWVTNKQKVKEAQYVSIDLHNLKNELTKHQQEIKTYKAELQKTDRNFLEIYYEDIFDGNLFLDLKLKKIHQILDYLGLGWFEEEWQLNKVKELLDPKKQKLNSAETYQLIPNIFEIEKELGCEETGYLFSQETNIYFGLGNKLQREGKLEQATGAYQCSVKQNPKFYATHHNLGEVLTRQGHFQESIAAYRRAIALNPNSAWSYNNLAEALIKQGETEDAITAYRHAIELKPDVTDFQKYLKEAITAHRRAIENNPNIPPKTTYYNTSTLNDRWIVEYVFPGKRKGYFFEAGAANGQNASSCFVLEKELDWTGICVEPNSYFFQELIVNRPNSICENICLAKHTGTVNYMEGSPNTISPYLGGIKENLEQFKHNGSTVVQLAQEVQKQALTMEAVLKKHQAPKIIDYAAFDIEGSELPVLEVFPFDEYLILALSIETGGVPWSKIYELLLAKGYVEVKNPFNSDKPYEKYVLHHSIL
ncbi:MAG TPA: tetratricopeptide repeat protein [Halomicronema sp.]